MTPAAAPNPGIVPGIRVGFLVAGTQKGGTTTLHAYLAAHPQICMPAGKELHFFDDEQAFAGGRPDYAAYHARFAPAPGQLLGETTPIYMYWQPAPGRIRDYNPGMKLLVMLRNPIERAYSHWKMECARGRETLPFGEALRAEAERCRQALPEQHRRFSYVDRGLYCGQLRRLWHFFPREQTLILRSEDLRTDPATVLDRVWPFLGVGRRTPRRNVSENASEDRTPMPDADRRFLLDAFEREIGELERLLGWDCADWLRPPAQAG